MGLLRWTDGALQADTTACIGCGRCAAACPEGALAVTGFVLPDDLPSAGSTLHVDCYRAPRDAYAWRVPCLAGVDLTHLLSLSVALPGFQIVVRDWQMCAGCPSSHAMTVPVLDYVVEEARRLLQAVGLPAALLPFRWRSSRPPRTSTSAQTGAGLEARVTRRAFFGRAVVEVAAIAEAPETGAIQPYALAGRGSTRRGMLVAMLRRLAKRHGGSIPADLFHIVRVSAQCSNHRVCASACPTAALRARPDGSGLDFDADLCTGCGICTRLCPERALSLAVAATPPPRGTVPVTRHEQSTCHRCEALFVPAKGETACPACRKAEELARSGFALMRRAAPWAEQEARAD